MLLATNPRTPDGGWGTGKAWRFRSPAEDASFHDKVGRLGAGASSVEKVAKAREAAAFEEDERIREAMGMGRPKVPVRPRISFEQLQLTNAVRAYINKLEQRSERTAVIDLPSGPAHATVRETQAPPRPKPDWLDGLGGKS